MMQTSQLPAPLTVSQGAFPSTLSIVCRLGKRCPVAIECTSNLVEARLAEATSQANAKSLAKLYSLAVLRCVGMLTDALQQGLHAVPMHKLANKAGIPEWLVDLRHEATHSLGAPSLTVARKAAEFLLDWLKREYWDTLDPDMSIPDIERRCEQSDFKAGDDLMSIVLDYQQEQFKLCMAGQKDPSRLEDTLKTLKERLSTEDSRNTLCSILIRDGFLIPTEEQVEALDVSGNYLSSFMSKKTPPEAWHPVIAACVEESNSYSNAVLKILLSTVCANLSASIKQKLCSILGGNPGVPTDENGEEVMVVGDEEVIKIGDMGSDEEATARLRGQRLSPWSLAPESIRWGRYPIGKLPAQSEDPQALSFLGRLDVQRVGDYMPDGPAMDGRSYSEASGALGQYPGSQCPWVGSEVVDDQHESSGPLPEKPRIDDKDVIIL